MGFTHNGEVYLVSDNIRNEEEAIRTLAHELTHSGLGKFFQRQRMSRALLPVRAQYEALMDAIYQAHGEEIEQLVKTTHRHLKIRTVQGRRQACEEWLCNQSYDSQPKWYDKLVAIFNDLLRALGLNVKLSDAEVRVVLQDAFKEFGGEGVNFKIAHHGTPHIWMPEPGFPHGRPRLDKIGTGEGAAAFGWGGYLAEPEETARTYVESLAKGDIVDKNNNIISRDDFINRYQPLGYTKNVLSIAYGRLGNYTNIDDCINDVRSVLSQMENLTFESVNEDLKDEIDLLQELKKEGIRGTGAKGSLYKLEIPDDVIPKLLDWDKPLSEQSEYIKILLGKNVNLVPGDVTHDIYTKTGKRLAWARGEEEKAEWERQGYVLRPVKPLDAKGSRYYEHLTQKFGSQKAASKYLASIGIPGNKYLDQMSRNYNIIDNQMKVAYDKFNGDAEAAADYLVQYLHDTPEEKSKARQNYINRFKRGYTYNYVIWDQKVLDRIALLERNGEKLDAIREEQEQEVPIEFQRSPVNFMTAWHGTVRRSQIIPLNVGEILTSYFNVNQVKAHKDYINAKSGDKPSATRLVRALVKDDTVAEARARYGQDVLYAYPHALESTGTNMIPAAMANYYAKKAGGKIAPPIVQTNKAYHTGAGAMERMIARPSFEGDVVPGGRYVLVDDATTLGGTFAEMTHHIQSNGGTVVGIISLTNASRMRNIVPQKAVIKEIERRFGNDVRELFGIEPSALTAAEAGYIIGFRNADTLRNRATKAISDRRKRLLSKGILLREKPVNFQRRSPVRRSQPMFSRSDNPDYKWWEGMDIQKQLESLPLKPWQKPRDFIAMGYVPITRAEANKLYYDGLDIFVAHVNIKGELDTTGNEGIFMRPLSFYGYQYRRLNGTLAREDEAEKRYWEYRQRYNDSQRAIQAAGRENTVQEGMRADTGIQNELQKVAEQTEAYSDGNPESQEVTNPNTIARLESDKKIKVYRAMQIIDGKLYPPMSASIGGKLRPATKIGAWEKAVEMPELADDKGYFKLEKGNKKSIKARYNPYFHTSRSPLNDQFSEAYKRPNLVTVEVEIPANELTSGYKAEKAKDTVGEMSWHSGPVSSKLQGDKSRKVILSRYAKAVRIVPDGEVAKIIAEMLGGENITIPDNVVTPSLKRELIAQGVNVGELQKVAESENRYSGTQGKGTANIPPETTTKAEAELIKEARKYKTADEFVKSQEVKGNDADYRNALLQGEGEDLRLDVSPDKKYIFEENSIPINSKEVTVYRSAPGELRPGDYAGLNKKTAELHLRNENDKIYSKKVSVSDLIQGADQFEVIYIPKDSVKTKTQLTDIWNKAQAETTRPSEGEGQTKFQRQEKETSIFQSLTEANLANPPMNASPREVKSSLYMNQAGAFKNFFDFFKSFKETNHEMSWMEKIVSSPEYWQHPVLQSLYQSFVVNREKYYHRDFQKLTNYGTDKDIVDLTTKLKREDTKGYEILDKIIDYGDSQYVKPKRTADEETSEEFSKEENARRNRAYLERALTDFKADVQKRFNPSQQVMEVWQAHRDSYDRALDMMQSRMTESLKNLGDTEKAQTIREKIDTLMNHMGEWRGFYAPRQRESGDFVVQAVKNAGTDNEIRERWHGTRFEMIKKRNDMQGQGWDVTFGKIDRLPESLYGDISMLDVGAMISHAIKKVEGKEEKEQRVLDELNEDVLQSIVDTIRSRGFRSTMIHRNREHIIRGYVTDPLTRLLRYSNNTAAGWAKADVAREAYETFLGNKNNETGKREGGIDPAKNPKVYEVGKNYIKEQLRNLDSSDRIIGLMKSIATFKYLGFSPRSAIVNMTAILTTATPAIHAYAMNGKGNIARIPQALMQAGSDYGKVMAGGKLSDTKEQAFIEYLHQMRYDNPQYTRDAMGELENKAGSAWSQAMKYSMWLFGKTEQWNRGATILAAYRMAKQQGQTEDQARKSAIDASNHAHGVYSRGTLPIWAQGENPLAKMGQLVYVYAKFGHNYMQMLYDIGMRKKDMSALIYAMAAPIVIGGAGAIPFGEEFKGIINALLKIIGVREPMEKWVWKQTRNNLGVGGERAGRYGMAGALGMDITGSLSIGVGVPKGLTDLTGAVGGVFDDLWKSGKFVSTGQYSKAAEKILPTGFSSPIRAYREATSGVTTENGNLLPTDKGTFYKPSAGETALRAAGVTGSEASRLKARMNEARTEVENWRDRRDKIHQMARVYFANPQKTGKDYTKILSMIQEYNKDWMQEGLMGSGIPRLKMSEIREDARKTIRPTKQQRRLMAM
jgi:hypothetical protein